MKKLWLAAVIGLVCVSCGDGDNNVAPVKTNNGTAGTNNGTVGTNNGTAGTNNGTTAGNNGTSGTNNGTAGTNNGTAGTNNGTAGSNNTTGTNNQTTTECMPLDPAIGPCDPLCQTGCEVGEHCIVSAEGVASCGGAGPRLQDEACSADTECGLGLHCRAVGGDDATCLAYCGREQDPGCPSGYGCIRLAADQRIGACIPVVNECDVVPTDTCADPDECYNTAQGRQCLPSGAAAADEACALSSECMAGLRCVNVSGVGQVCKPLCDPNGAADCAEGSCRTLANQSGETLSWGACF